MVTVVVVVVDEVGDGPLKLAGEFIRDLVHFPLDALVVALQLAVGLGMEGCRQGDKKMAQSSGSENPLY